ncbi:MAG: calcineurin-like phosphoesterase C-terminal domain-containing protein [Bacteroidales bacterium]|nr:calcineurin-like phosphoesterase C-terminal domain-containing protein [Bacteroidales bacterium]
MKKRHVIILCLLSLFFGGCNRETMGNPAEITGYLTGIRLDLSQPSKTSLSYDSENQLVKSFWLSSDKALVTDLASSARFDMPEDTEHATSADFHGSLAISASSEAILAVYPYDKASLSGSTLKATLPVAQNATDPGSYDLKAGCVPLPGEGSLSELGISLKNLLALLRVRVKVPASLGGYSLSEEEILSLTVDSDLPVAGETTLGHDGDLLTAGPFTSNTLTYTFPDGCGTGVFLDAFVFLAPGDYSGSSIVWSLETTGYNIQFKVSPGKDLEAGFFYDATFNLGAAAWNIVTSAPAAERDCRIVSKADPVITKTVCSPSTGSICWTEPASQTARKYTVDLLEDASATTVLREYSLKLRGGDKAAFTFGGLAPSTTYYARVMGAQGRGLNTNWSQTVSFTTDAAINHGSDNLLSYADFDLCPWGGDYMNLALSTKPQTDTQSSLSAGWSNCYTNIITDTDASYTNFPRLAGSFSANYSAMLSELGLEGWTFNNVYMRPGYAQIGNSSAATLTSPALTALSNGLHTVNVDFKAVPFSASGSKSGTVTVNCLSSSGTLIDSRSVSLPATPAIPSELPEWTSCQVSFNNVPSGGKIQFSNGGSSNDFCIDEIEISSDDALVPIEHDPGNNVYGLIADASGNPLSGVVVSDGYVVTTTAADGVYQFNSAKANGYVFISQPQGYEVALDGVFPQFWQALEGGSSVEERHDFRLTPVNNSDCVILALGDFHLCNRNALYDLQQFRMEVQELKSTVQSLQAQGKKVYGLTLGDMTWDIYWDSSSGYNGCNFDLAAYRNEVNNDFAGVDFPIWHTIGNHDHAYYYTGDWDTVIPFKQILGPTYYSFNAGGYHIISLDNVICANDGTTGGRDDSPGLTSDILSWLQADIALVPSGMPVIVSMHEQAYSPTNPTGGYSAETYASSLESALSGRNIHIVTGHTHNINNVPVNDSLYEHNAGALCATWWWTGRFSITNEAAWGGGTSLADTYHIGRDGAPAGYTVYNLSNGSMTWKYKAFGLPETRQFKTYDRNQFTLKAADYNIPSARQSTFEDIAANGDGQYPYTKAPGERIGGIFSDKVPENLVYINVWNWDPSWDLTVREGSNILSYTPLTGAYDPMHIVAYPAVRLQTANTTSTFVTKGNQHMFRVTASSATSTLTITVTDRFGNTYTETMTRPKTFAVNWD